jgi:hypothetical protein
MKLEKADSKYGAQMGRPNRLPDDLKAPIKLRLKALRLFDAAYDAGGAYWGATPGTGIFWAYNSKENVQVFVRAKNRAAAKREVTELLPKATFLPSKDDKQQTKHITPPKTITTKDGKVYTYPDIVKSLEGGVYTLQISLDYGDVVFNAVEAIARQGIDSCLEAFSEENDCFRYAKGLLHIDLSAGSIPVMIRRLAEQEGTEELVASIIKDLGVKPRRPKPKK